MNLTLTTDGDGLPPMQEIHVHLHIHTDGQVRVTTGSTGSEVSAEDEPDHHAAEVAEILERYERYDRSSRARDVHDALTAQGWAAVPHQRREYVRLITPGREHQVTLYLNTLNLVCAGVKIAPFAATLPTADRRSNGNVHFYFDGRRGTVETALDAAAAIKRFADGAS